MLQVLSYDFEDYQHHLSEILITARDVITIFSDYPMLLSEMPNFFEDIHSEYSEFPYILDMYFKEGESLSGVMSYVSSMFSVYHIERNISHTFRYREFNPPTNLEASLMENGSSMVELDNYLYDFKHYDNTILQEYVDKAQSAMFSFLKDTYGSNSQTNRSKNERVSIVGYSFDFYTKEGKRYVDISVTPSWLSDLKLAPFSHARQQYSNFYSDPKKRCLTWFDSKVECLKSLRLYLDKLYKDFEQTSIEQRAVIFKNIKGVLIELNAYSRKHLESYLKLDKLDSKYTDKGFVNTIIAKDLKGITYDVLLVTVEESYPNYTAPLEVDKYISKDLRRLKKQPKGKWDYANLNNTTTIYNFK